MNAHLERMGSIRLPCYNGMNGAKKDPKPVAFVGKGVTFDTGDIH